MMMLSIKNGTEKQALLFTRPATLLSVYQNQQKKPPVKLQGQRFNHMGLLRTVILRPVMRIMENQAQLSIFPSTPLLMY